MSASSTIATISSALSLINGGIPVLLSAYATLRTIWSAANPGKTEEEFVASLRETSLTGEAFSRAWLLSHQYVQSEDGTWRKQTS